MTEQPDYLAADLERRLATDPRVAELGLHVAVAGDRVRVTGTVSGPDCRSLVAAVLAEAAPGYDVVNEVECIDVVEPAPGDAEELP